MKQHYMVNRTDGIGLHASPARDARGAPIFVGAPRGQGTRAPQRRGEERRGAPGSAGAVPGRSALAGGSVHLMVTLERAE